jgi:phytol kinase
MSPELVAILKLAAAFLALFGFAEVLYHKLRVPAEYTRSIVHAGTGLLTLLFPVMLHALWQVILLCGSFLALLLTSIRFGWLPSINAVSRRSQGSWLFPVIVVICFWYSIRMQSATDPLFRPYYYFAVPLLLLAICDPAAAITGRLFRKKFPQTAPGKTLAGSFAFLLLAGIICIAGSYMLTNGKIPSHFFFATGLATAFIACLSERHSGGGWDNFTIPASALLCMAATDYAL